MRKGGGALVGRRKKKKKEKEKNSFIQILGSGHVLPRKNPWVLAENVLPPRFFR